ncbi:phosphotransferase system eiib component type 2/3 [Lucifera butyrica]|uniref:Phosphotransferase system eiib component type 2/3 n=1 Tax=Lucifera butyrica TaxID=1351585 RepID=A0A498RA14_9FIRM|nr:PTS sugar transporter subunit IIA [Lucifera butyrica]VBB07122.1 phosphotransferase system eiib component type 2/3 [Lucifera butyrica]
MTGKEVELILLLASRQEYTTYHELKTILQRSERTIRYYLEQANQLLQQNHLPQIEQDRKLGVKLQFTASQKEQFSYLLKSAQYHAEYYSVEERVLMILFSILDEKTPSFATAFIEDLITSKSSIDSDMKTIRKQAQEYGVAVKSVPKEGFKFLGDEWSIRLFINNVINKYINLEMMMDHCSSRSIFSKKEKIVTSYLQEEILFKIYQSLQQIARTDGLAFNEMHCRQMSVIFAIWYKRFTQGYLVNSTNSLPLRYEKLHSYHIVIQLLQEVMGINASEISEYERYYLCFIIDSFNIRNPAALKIDWGGLQLLTIQLIKEMEKITSIPFLDDKELFERLFNHIEPLVNRSKNGVSIFNPLKNMIMEQYSITYNAVCKAVSIVEEYCRQKISEEEIAYITLHFSASEEKLAQHNPGKYRVVVICGHGVATGELLAENLKKYYQFDVIGVVNGYDLPAIKRLGADFALKTIDIEIKNLPSLKIDPVLTEYDRKKIKKFIESNPDIKKTGGANFDAVNFFKDICKIAEKHSMKIKMGNFIEELEDLFEKNKIILNRQGVQPMIQEVVKDHHILLQHTSKDWETCIKDAAQPLLEDHYINQDYVDAMIGAVKKYGPYIVVAKGVALAHARPEDGAAKLGLSIMTLKEPIYFGHESNDPVKLIFCLAAIDNFSHLKVMKSIVNIIAEECKIDKISNQYTVDDLKRVLVEFEEGL